MAEASSGRVIGRYALFDVIATGGMATVHFGRLLGPVGFARTVAIKRLHPQYASDPEFVSMFLDEARMCARIRHPNVVPTLDVVAAKGELFLVMEYIQGESLGHLFKTMQKSGGQIPWRISLSIVAGALQGLHAAHEAKDERGIPLGLVHRDVSPQNILVGVDGMARVLDFGIAKASGRIHITRESAVKGKVGYMAPEQMSSGEITRQADVYAAAVVLWEALAGRRLFDGDNEVVIMARVLAAEIKPPSTFNPEVPSALDALVLRALGRGTDGRHTTAKELAQALERIGPASVGEVGEWVEKIAGASLDKRSQRVSLVEIEVTPAGEPDAPEDGTGEASGVHPSARSIEEPGGMTPSGRAQDEVSSRRRARWIAGGIVTGAAVLTIGGWAMVSSSSTAPANAHELTSGSAQAAPSVPAESARATAVATATATATPAASATADASARATASARPSASVKSWGPNRPPTASAPKSPFNLGGRN